MKKIIICITLCIGFNLSNAQQKYFPFSIADKHGITDTLGNETVKPSYENSKMIEAKNQIYLQNFSSKSDVIFDAKTGAKQFFESVYGNRVKIGGVNYSEINNKDKQYLLSEQSSKKIPLTEDYTDFKNVGDYIIATFYPKPVLLKASYVDKNGIPRPPEIVPMPAKIKTILAGNETLNRLTKFNFDTYLPMYKKPEKEKNDGLVHVKLIDIKDYTETVNFDFILLTKGNTHNLYNGKMVFIKTFVLPKATDELLLNASKKILKLDLSLSQKNSYPSPMVMVAPTGVSTRPVEPRKIEEKPFRPFFYTEDLANGNTLFALQETEQISNHILEVKSDTKVYLDKKANTLTISLEGKEDSKFSFNPKTGVVYLPKVYFKQLGITII